MVVVREQGFLFPTPSLSLSHSPLGTARMKRQAAPQIMNSTQRLIRRPNLCGKNLVNAEEEMHRQEGILNSSKDVGDKMKDEERYKKESEENSHQDKKLKSSLPPTSLSHKDSSH